MDLSGKKYEILKFLKGSDIKNQITKYFEYGNQTVIEIWKLTNAFGNENRTLKLLAKLEKTGYVDKKMNCVEPLISGIPRFENIYSITPAGRHALDDMRTDFARKMGFEKPEEAPQYWCSTRR